MDYLLTPKQVAEILNCRPSTIYAWVKEGKIPAIKINGLLRFESSKIKDWIKGFNIESKPLTYPRTKHIRKGDIDVIVKRTIASVKGYRYNSPYKGKLDQNRPGKEV